MSSRSDRKNKMAILGTRGVPARHGGFETFAAQLAPYLVANGWEVTVYCQLEPGHAPIPEDEWNGVRRVHIPTKRSAALGTIEFDLKAAWHAAREDSLKLVLGYNTAIFNFILRFHGRRVVMNMDGIEWRRDKWSFLQRIWLRVNEFLGMVSSQHLIADHPEIEDHLRSTWKHTPITMIPYGAYAHNVSAVEHPLLADLSASRYFLVVARIEPENSILEIVRAHAQLNSDAKLVVLGNLEPETNSYHAEVVAAASDDCIFPGAIYDSEVVAKLRARSVAYVHGHTVGGTNPSLVEALAAGAAVLAHDNKFNRWVALEGAVYFADQVACMDGMERLLKSPALVAQLQANSLQRHSELFTWPVVLSAYEKLLESLAGSSRS